ncbi:hypothetical protein Nepgr_033560 [Nepenthes gracilis]|uniref:Uncharacterized protein n=1 Tax=Nepenthes gracilis TaxID=150966 RepID=A0AAD3TM75_NEPGR|nr:hypothetical protein Nepgr_033560 [Nepenthes gracilis]
MKARAPISGACVIRSQKAQRGTSSKSPGDPFRDLCCSILEAVGLKPEQHSSSLAVDDNEAGLGATSSFPLVSALPEIDIMLRPDSAPLLGPSTGSNGVAADVKGEASALWDPALVGMDCGRDQSVTVLAPLRVLSGRSKGPEVDSSLMRSDCSVEGHILTAPELGAGPLSADTSSAPGGSNVDEELLNVVASVSGDCCVDLEEQIDSESIQQFAVPLPVAGVSDESGEDFLLLLILVWLLHYFGGYFGDLVAILIICSVVATCGISFAAPSEDDEARCLCAIDHLANGGTYVVRC